jgi:hypothetical protein
MPSRARLYAVRPPDEASTGKPVSASASYKAHHVALIPAASFKGTLACALIRAKHRGLAGKDSSTGRAPFSVLQGTQAR